LAGETLPSGQPMPPVRRYAEMLVREDRLPLYNVGSLKFSLDLHNPRNEAAVPAYTEDPVDIAIVADRGYFTPNVPNAAISASLPRDEQLQLQEANGRLLGELVAALAEATSARFAYADIQATGWVVKAATDSRFVVHPAPTRVKPWDYLWSINAWGPELLDQAFAERIRRLEMTDEIAAGIDPFERRHYRLERRMLANGALFL
jgi:hypothetical protein